MTTPQRGDRVRVEYEATYDGQLADGYGHAVTTTTGPDGAGRRSVPAGAKLTVLPKRLRVGDKVRLGVDPEPPRYTVLLDGDGFATRRAWEGWTFSDATVNYYEWAELASFGKGVALVVSLPEVSS